MLTCTVNYPYSVVYRKKNIALQFCKNVFFNKINYKNINNYRFGELYSGMVLINKQSLIEELSELEINNMTPIDAIQKLEEWKKEYDL